MNRDEVSAAESVNAVEAPSGASKPPSAPELQKAIPAALAGVTVILLAGLLAGWLLTSRIGEMGLIVLWPGGYLAGVVAKTIMKHPSKAVGLVLAVSCLAAAVLAETFFIRYATEAGEGGWVTSLTWLPALAKVYQMSVFIAVLTSGFGGYAAYREAGQRYQLVRVPVSE